MAGRRVTRPAPIARHVKMHSWPLELLKKSSRVSCKPQPTLITCQIVVANIDHRSNS